MPRNDVQVWPYYRPDLVFIYRIIESSTFSLVFLVVIFYIRLLLRKEFCHPNLRFLLITQPICHISALALRPIRHTIDYFGLMNPVLLKMINYSSDSLLTICFQIVLAYSVERIIAIKYVENYENRWTKRPTLGILLLIGSISSEQGLLFLWYLGLNNTFAYSLQYLFFVTAAIFFIVLHIICKRAYATVANRKESTINERFQTARNLKAAHLLLHLAPFKCAANFVSLYFYHWIFEEQSPIYFPLYSTYYFWLNQLQLMIQMALTVVGQDCLKEELCLMIGRRHRVHAQGITTILGKPMVFTAEQTNQVYFEQIQQSWDIVLNNNQTTREAKYKAPI